MSTVSEVWHSIMKQSITVYPQEKVIVVIQSSLTNRGLGYEDVVQYCRDLTKKL